MECDNDWKFSQCFGERTAIEDLNEADLISAVEFDKSGSFLATGDRGGRIVVFELDGHNGVESIAEAVGSARRPLKAPLEYRFQSEFQSHEPEFDYLKSLDIEEKINRIRWCQPSNNALFLLSTNDKTVKLWKVFEKDIKIVQNFNLPPQGGPGGGGAPKPVHMFQKYPQDENNATLVEGCATDDRAFYKPFSIPRLEVLRLKKESSVMTASSRRVFANAHAYHINSVSVNSDGETFMSADDLRINLWNLNINTQSYNIVDIKPANMEELAEVITAAEFHPTHCNLFMYSSSRGSIRLGDMRARALCDVHAKTFEEAEQPGNKNFFSEIIASLSDIKFSNDGRYIVSRDYLTVKIWDINMESKPVKTINIHEHLRSKLGELYENECIFDKFEVAVSGDGNNLATGSYNSTFHIYDRYGGLDLCIEASKMPLKQQQLYQQEGIAIEPAETSALQEKSHDNDFLDYNRKALYMSWHPEYPLLAVAAVNNLFIYSK